MFWLKQQLQKPNIMDFWPFQAPQNSSLSYDYYHIKVFEVPVRIPAIFFFAAFYGWMKCGLVSASKRCQAYLIVPSFVTCSALF